jgi:hypothetical protein
MQRGERIVFAVWLALVALGFLWIGQLEGVQR